VLIALLVGIPLFLLLLAGLGVGGYYYYTNVWKKQDDSVAQRSDSSKTPGSQAETDSPSPTESGGSQLPSTLPVVTDPNRPLSSQEIATELTRSSVLIAVKWGSRELYQTGCIIDVSHRLVVTSSHAFDKENPSEVTVYFPMFEKNGAVVTDFQRYKTSSAPRTKGRVVSRAEETNLALLQLDQLPPQALAVVLPSQPIQPEQKVYTLRNSVSKPSRLWQVTEDTVLSKSKWSGSDLFDDLEDLLDATIELLRLEAFGLDDDLAKDMKTEELKEMKEKERQVLRNLNKLFGDDDAVTSNPKVFPTSTNSSGDVNGGPVVNQRAELVGIMVQRHTKDRRICFNIPVSEIENLVKHYFAQRNTAWHPRRGREVLVREAFQLLLRAVEQGEKTDQIAAVRQLAELGPQAQSALPTLLRVLPNADPAVQQEIEQTLYRLGAPTPDLSKTLVDALFSSSPVLRNYAARMFAEGTPPLPAVEIPNLIARFSTLPADIQRLLITAILKTDETQYIRLLELAEVTQGPVQAEVLAKLYALPPPDASCTPYLVKYLQSRSADLRNYAIRMFANNTPPLPREYVSQVVDLLKVAQGETRRDLFKILRHIGPAGRSIALGEVLDALVDSDVEIAQMATALLEIYGQAHPEDKPLLREKLRHRYPEVRQKALTLLLPLCSDQETAQIWTELLKDSNLQIRRQAVQNALQHPLLQSQLNQIIASLLSDTDVEIRKLAVHHLRQSLPLARSLLTELLANYQGKIEKDPQLAQEISYILATVVPPETQYLTLLRELLRHPYASTRREAALRLKEMKTNAFEAVPDLVECFQKDSDPSVRAAAVHALTAIGPPTQVVNQLIPLFDQLLTNFPRETALSTAPNAPDAKRSPEEELALAVIEALASFGVRGRNTLELQIRNTRLSDAVRELICVQLASAKDLTDDNILLIIEFAEHNAKVRPVLTEMLVKNPRAALIDELLLLTSAWKPPSRAGGKRDVPYPVDYRCWAIQTLGNLNLRDLSPTQREKVLRRLNYLAKDDSNPQINSTAQIALKRINQSSR
jgi:HEAT repeat protein